MSSWIEAECAHVEQSAAADTSKVPRGERVGIGPLRWREIWQIVIEARVVDLRGSAPSCQGRPARDRVILSFHYIRVIMG